MDYLTRLMNRYPQLSECREQICEAYEILVKAYEKGNKLLICGNGGSCADCDHIVGELMKGFLKKRPLDPKLSEKISALTDDLLPETGRLLQIGLPAIALTNHNALSTAVQNDQSPELSMAQQVVALGNPGDVLMGISTSGNAKNVALAVSVAKAMGLITIGLTGRHGGRLKTKCDMTICVPADNPADTQELHLPVYHAICAMVEEYFFTE